MNDGTPTPTTDAPTAPATPATIAAVVPANPKACSACPWRLSNQGQPHPHNFYSKTNLKRLWKGLRRGERMSCHPSDPRMAEFTGYEDCAERAKTSECTGALILQQREFMLFQEIAKDTPKGSSGLKAYAKQRPNGLTREAFIVLVDRAMFAAVNQDVAMAKPNLSDDEVGYPMIGVKR